MRLSALREELLRELSSSESQCLFDQAKQKYEEFHQHDTLNAVLAALEDRDAIGYEGQDRLLRILVAEAQAHPEQPLWRRLLLCAFVPGLMRIRHRASDGVHDPDDVDSALWTSFFEVLHRYPLGRSGSVAAGLLLDTNKAYVCAMQREYAARQHEAVLLARMHDLPGSEERFEVADLEDASTPTDADVVREILATLAPQDVELLWATTVEGMTIRKFVQSRGLGREGADAEEREVQRLKRRRHRLLLRLRKENGKK